MNDRLTQFLTAEQLSPTRFADLLGVQRSGVSHILSGRNKPGLDFLEKFIKRFPAVNIEWFITGKGKMYKEMNMSSLFPQLSENEKTAVEVPRQANDHEWANQPEIIETDNINVSQTTSDVSNSNMLNSLPEKSVEKVMIFYTDRTFESYRPTS